MQKHKMPADPNRRAKAIVDAIDALLDGTREAPATPDVFDLVRDDTDYTVPKERWTRPTLPKNLAEVRASRSN